mmetsp:Transcript_16174/g.38380  ORF Transcript_16174/g.38380 Transcript_16174/m.38380 type:complete len:250 (+) Transcript_16174:3495-4244(+)
MRLPHRRRRARVWSKLAQLLAVAHVCCARAHDAQPREACRGRPAALHTQQRDQPHHLGRVSRRRVRRVQRALEPQAELGIENDARVSLDGVKVTIVRQLHAERQRRGDERGCGAVPRPNALDLERLLLLQVTRAAPVVRVELGQLVGRACRKARVPHDGEAPRVLALARRALGAEEPGEIVGEWVSLPCDGAHAPDDGRRHARAARRELERGKATGLAATDLRGRDHLAQDRGRLLELLGVTRDDNAHD